ncbi:hypothetical protein C0J52_19283 [Blattella germanica]|nr:hypothetical protein C0J52_19283 [Blattella germanica]
MRAVGRGAHRKSPREITVRARGILPDPISESAYPLRQALAPFTISQDCQFASYRAAFLCSSGGEDAHRDADKGHAVERKQLQLALHELDVTQRLEAIGFRVNLEFLPRSD